MEAGDWLRVVREGDLAAIGAALAAQPELVNAVGPHPSWGGQPQALHVAVETRQWEVLLLLLDAGADVNGSNAGYDHWSPLMLAAFRDEFAMWDELVRRGATIGVAEALLKGIDSRLPDALPETVPNGGSWLMFARTPRAIDHLVTLGASLEQPDRWGTTPMMAFSQRGMLLVNHFRKYGVRASLEDLARLNSRECAPEAPAGDSVLRAAVQHRHHELVEWLLAERGGNAQARAEGQSRQTLLHEAAWNGDLAMAQLLVRAGAELEALDEEHQATPQHWAETAFAVRKVEACREVAEWLGGQRRPPD